MYSEEFLERAKYVVIKVMHASFLPKVATVPLHRDGAL